MSGHAVVEERSFVQASNSSISSSAAPSSGSVSAELLTAGTQRAQQQQQQQQQPVSAKGLRGVGLPQLRLPAKGGRDEDRGAELSAPLSARGREVPAEVSDDDDEDFDDEDSEKDSELDNPKGVHTGAGADGPSAGADGDREVSRGRREAAEGRGGSAATGRVAAGAERSSSSSLGDAPKTSGRHKPTAKEQGGSHGKGRSPLKTSSAPAGTFMEQSDCSDFSGQGTPQDPRQRGDEENEGPRSREASRPWHETLLRFPSLIRLYPMADSSEFEGGGTECEEELNGLPPPAKDADDPASKLVADAAAGAAACDAALAEPDEADWRSAAAASASTQSSPSWRGTARAMPDAENIASARAGSTPVHAGARHAPWASEAHAVPPGTTQDDRYQAFSASAWPGAGAPHGGSAPCTPVMHGRARATPHSVPSRAGGAYPRSYPNGEQLSMAWAEVEQVRQGLLRQERELAQRESAARRAEARNAATAQQLGELRHRLDDYSAELEQSVVALTAQQQGVQEERRQTLEMQARVRRMCAAAVRDDVVASKAQNWHRAWTPTQTMGP